MEKKAIFLHFQYDNNLSNVTHSPFFLLMVASNVFAGHQDFVMIDTNYD